MTISGAGNGISRRRVLLGGGAISALGALQVMTPKAAWSWSPLGSIAGSGAGLDPMTVWDAAADPVVAGIIDRGEVDQVNALLRTWTKNAQALPAGLPADLRDFIESACQLPSWADRAKLDQTKDFYKRRGTYLGTLYGVGSGMMSTLIPHEARAVYYSNGGYDLKDRISKTAKLGYDIGSLSAYDADGEMIVTAVKTRLIHAAVRHLLPTSAYWAAVADEDKPISQRDIMITWHSLASFSWQKMNDWKIKLPQVDADAYLHSWQVTAHMLGVLDEYIPATWSEAASQSTQLLDPLLVATPEGLNLADRLLHLASEYDGGASYPFLCAATRNTLGNQRSDWLKIPRHPVLDEAVAAGWPQYIAMKEGWHTLGLPLSQELTWGFDEFLRLGTLMFLSEGKPISIEIPSGNNPSPGGSGSGTGY
jgi:hypothetical protein